MSKKFGGEPILPRGATQSFETVDETKDVPVGDDELRRVSEILALQEGEVAQILTIVFGRPGENSEESLVSTREMRARQPYIEPLGTAGRRRETSTIRGLVEKWRGMLSDMLPLQPAPEMGFARLSAASGPVASANMSFSGVEKPLADMFEPAILAGDLSWAQGTLRLACARSADGCIAALHASVERSDARAVNGSAIVLIFSDGHATETLKLRARRTSGIVQNTSLRGEPSNIGIAISLGSDD